MEELQFVTTWKTFTNDHHQSGTYKAVLLHLFTCFTKRVNFFASHQCVESRLSDRMNI